MRQTEKPALSTRALEEASHYRLRRQAAPPTATGAFRSCTTDRCPTARPRASPRGSCSRRTAAKCRPSPRPPFIWGEISHIARAFHEGRELAVATTPTASATWTTSPAPSVARWTTAKASRPTSSPTMTGRVCVSHGRRRGNGPTGQNHGRWCPGSAPAGASDGPRLHALSPRPATARHPCRRPADRRALRALEHPRQAPVRICARRRADTGNGPSRRRDFKRLAN